MTQYELPQEKSFGQQENTTGQRELVLVVAHGWGKRLGASAATHLFDTMCAAIESQLEGLQPWERPDGHALLPRRMVWKGLDAGRKVVMPLVQDAARKWSYHQALQDL